MRAVYRPINTAEHTLHLGLSAVARTPERVTSDEGIVSLGGHSGSAVENRAFVAGRFSGIDHYTIGGLEAAYRNDHFFVQIEALRSTFVSKIAGAGLSNGNRSLIIDGDRATSFWGAYGFATYMLRGKQRSYSNGSAAFSNVHDEVEPGGNLELLAGGSVLDAEPLLGQGYELVGALNWYPNAAMMLGLSYTFTGLSDEATALGRLRSKSGEGLSYSTLQLRAQFVF